MEKSSNRKISRVTKDIISELPRHIQESILAFLPLRDAVRTSILSRKWRHCWTTIPHLEFDAEFFYSLRDKISRYDDPELLAHDPELLAHKFASVMNKILLLHDGSILKFYLWYPYEDCDAKIISEYVEQWIPLLSRKGTKQLSLDNLERGEFSAHHLYKLRLTHLRLVSAWFSSTPTYGGLPYLVNLELIDVATSEQRIFDCPVLEKLILIDCEGIFPNNFRAPKLKCLHQLFRNITKECSLAGLENLTECSFALYRNGSPMKPTKACNLVEILSSLHKVEKFSVVMLYLTAGGSPNRLSKPLPYLKTLNISDIDFSVLSDVSCLLCLIRSAPNLCTLNISAEYYIDEGLKDYCIEDSEDGTIDYLEIVTFTNLKGLRAELELVKFLLARSPMLKTMSIHYSRAIKMDVALTLGEEVSQYFTASSRAQIRYLGRPVYFEDLQLIFDY